MQYHNRYFNIHIHMFAFFLASNFRKLHWLKTSFILHKHVTTSCNSFESSLLKLIITLLQNLYKWITIDPYRYNFLNKKHYTFLSPIRIRVFSTDILHYIHCYWTRIMQNLTIIHFPLLKITNRIILELIITKT